MTAQLDIFGAAHVRPTRRRPAVQPSLFDRDAERRDEGDQLRAALEEIRRAGNPDESPSE